MSLGEFLIRPTAMFYRNLMSLEVEELIRANPLDGVVLLGGCDKTTAGLMMGLASADVPAILITGGPQRSVHWRGETLGSCTDCRRYQHELRAGRISTDDWMDLQSAMVPGPGHCMTMGTASTLAVLSEILGIGLRGNGTIPAEDAARRRLSERAGRLILDAVRADRKPSRILTRAAFQNAIRVLHAIAGSTNAIIHLIAVAGRLGIELPLAEFDRLSQETPTLLNLKPTGPHLMEDFHWAGGVPALCQQLKGHLELGLPTVSGETLGEALAYDGAIDASVIAPVTAPLRNDGGLAVLTGTLAPRGAVIKQSAASPELSRHRGRAVVFEDHHDLLARIDHPDLDVTPNDVLVLKNAGPLGGPGMPEWGVIPIPAKLARQGVRDMVRLSDARISGTAFGTVIVHVSPESAAKGPLAAVQNGDWIELNLPERRLDLLLDDETIQRRLASLGHQTPATLHGYRRLYASHVLQADRGCDFDFLTRIPS